METSPQPEPVARSDRARNARVALGVLLLVVLVALVVDNKDDTRIGYVVGDVRAPLFVVLIVAAVLGALVGWLVLHRPGRRDST